MDYRWEELRYQLTRPTAGSAVTSLHLGQELGSFCLGIWSEGKKGSQVLNPQLRDASWNHKHKLILEDKLPELQFIEIFLQNNTWKGDVFVKRVALVWYHVDLFHFTKKGFTVERRL